MAYEQVGSGEEEASPLQIAAGTDPASPEKEGRVPRYRRKVISGDEAEDLVQDIIEDVEDEKDNRQGWMDKRMERLAYLRGWTDTGSGIWANDSNQHLPLMMANSLRTKAGIFNAVLGGRPVINSIPTREEHEDIARLNDHLLDYQMFVEFAGDRAISTYIDNYVDEGTAISYQPRVFERRSVCDVKTIRRPDIPMAEIGQEIITDLLLDVGITTDRLRMMDESGMSWEASYRDDTGLLETISLEVYDRVEADDRLDVVYERLVTTFDGPAMLVLDLEDFYVPMRSENPQPVSPHNPNGAPWVVKRSLVSVDEIRRRARLGIYDMLSDADVDDIADLGVSRMGNQIPDDEEELRDEKDAKTGLEGSPSSSRSRHNVWITVYEWYGGYDLNGDGLEEECIFWILKEPRKLARARYLSEQYPGLPLRRPFSHARFIEVPGQFYGIGQAELTEGLVRFMHELVNDNVNAGKLASIPMFAYRASSGQKPETLRVEPGLGIPVDSPMQDLNFFNFTGGDQSWSFNMISLATGMLDKLSQMNPLMFGQMPQGKSSALRTSGNMQALLQQSAAFPEQILRRLLLGLKDVWSQFHLLNTRFLPAHKRIRVAKGAGDPHAKAYLEVDDRRTIDIPLTFDFRASLTNTNAGLRSQTLQNLGSLLIQPVMIQLGLVTPEHVYNWAAEIIRAGELEPEKFIQRPANLDPEPPITVEEAKIDLLNGVIPRSTRFNIPTQEALQFLIDFMNSDEFAGMLGAGKEVMFKNYMLAVGQRIQHEMQQMALQQAAEQFAQQAPAGGEGGRPSEPGAVPPPQAEAPTPVEIQGAEDA